MTVKAPPRPEVGRKKKEQPDERKFKTLAVRATEEWFEWAERGAKHCRMNISTAVDVALTEFFRSKGFTEPPPKRY